MRYRTDPVGLSSEAGTRPMWPVIADWLPRRRGRQERLDCSQQIADVYWLGDIGSASTLQSVRFVSRRYAGGHGNDWNVLGLIVLLEQKSSIEPTDVGQ